MLLGRFKLVQEPQYSLVYCFWKFRFVLGFIGLLEPQEHKMTGFTSSAVATNYPPTIGLLVLQESLFDQF